jgi:hypothetical protein
MPTRAKGTLSTTQINADWPYQVEIEVPERGLGRRFTAMLAWAGANSPSHKRRGGSLDSVRLCFPTSEIATAFQVEFGGTLIHEPPPRSSRSR